MPYDKDQLDMAFTEHANQMRTEHLHNMVILEQLERRQKTLLDEAKETGDFDPVLQNLNEGAAQLELMLAQALSSLKRL